MIASMKQQTVDVTACLFSLALVVEQKW